MFKKLLPWYLLGLVVISLAFIYGCGSATSGGGGGGGGSSTNYTITGKCSSASMTTDSFSISTAPKHITRIVAIGSDGTTYSTTPESDGSFSLGIVKGVPYVLGFYDGTTLEGYLKVSSLGWDSLPIFNPSGSSINLGTLDANASTLVISSEINASDLSSFMQMSSTVADYYGAIDDAMVNMLNIDVNKNGIPDFDESAGGLYLTVAENGGPGKGITTGEIPKMLVGYNDTYVPRPYSYQYWLTSISLLISGEVVTLEAPALLTNAPPSSTTFNTMTKIVESSPGDYCRYAHFGNEDQNAVLPTTPPPGTYVATVGTLEYTFDNCSFSGAHTVGPNDNIIYPVFHLNTEESGGETYISSVDYKWMKVVGGLAVEVTDHEEVKVAVGNYSNGTAIAGQSPNIQFSGGTSCPESYIYFDRDALVAGEGTLDLGVATINGEKIPPIKLSDVSYIRGQYVTSTNIQIDFYFGWDPSP